MAAQACTIIASVSCPAQDSSQRTADFVLATAVAGASSEIAGARPIAQPLPASLSFALTWLCFDSIPVAAVNWIFPVHKSRSASGSDIEEGRFLHERREHCERSG
jgi:hypothetical protein